MVNRPHRYSRKITGPFPEEGSGLAFPKPRFIPKEERADLTRLALPKDRPDRDADYLAFVRNETCAAWSHECAGVTEAAHLYVHGKGIKASDFFTIPLCSEHHRRQHNVGIATFQQNEGVNLW